MTGPQFSDSVPLELDIEELRLLSVENSMAISWKTDQILNQGQEIMLRLDSVGCIVQGYMQQFIQQQEMRDARIKTALEAQKAQFDRELAMRDAKLKAENAQLIADMMNTFKETFDDHEKNLVTKFRQGRRLIVLFTNAKSMIAYKENDV